MYFHTHRCLLDYRIQILVIAGTLLTFITDSNSLKIRNVTKGTYTTINCTYGVGEVHNLFWHPGNCSEEPPMPWIVRYLNGKVNSSDETRFWLGDDNSTLILKNVSIEDEGTYCCSVDIKSGVLNPYQFLTRVYVFGLDSKTLPVIPQCQEDDHDDLNSTTCTLNSPTNLTCELHGIYPKQGVQLEWHGDQGVIPSISETYPSDDMTSTFVATIHVLEAGNFWCKAFFPSEAGPVETIVQVTVKVHALGLDAKTLPVIRQCQEDDHNPTTCTLYAPTKLTCELHGIYPKQDVQLEWHGDQGVISSISDYNSKADMTSTFVATIHVSEAGSFWCNASFPSEVGLVKTGVQVTVRDPANSTSDLTTIEISVICVTIVIIIVIIIICYVIRRRRQTWGWIRVYMTRHQGNHSTDESRCKVRITEEQLIELSENFPHDQYTNLCAQLHLSYSKGQNILNENLNNHKKAVMEVLMKWKRRKGGVCRELCSALDKAGVGGTLKPLIHIAADPRTAEEQL